jgi:HK97 family phage prohead protease
MPCDCGKYDENGEKREEVALDVFTTEDEALIRAESLGCMGFHAMGGQFMPCETHEEYLERIEGLSTPAGPVGRPTFGGGGGKSAPDPETLETRKVFGIQIEKRSEVRGPGTLVGYAAVFDRDSHDLGGFTESIRSGAFSRSLREGADVRALRDHDPSKVLGRSGSGTLRLVEDAVGLRSEIDLPDTELGRETAELVRRGDLDGMSFGFSAESDSWSERDGRSHRELSDLDIFDVSVVSFPAYPDAAVAGIRSLERHKGSEKPEAPECAEGHGDPADLRRAISLRLVD